MLSRTLLFLLVSAGLLAETKWSEFRRTPFFVTFSDRDEEAKVVANEIEQLRHVLSRELGAPTSKLEFPMRVLVTDQPPSLPALSRDGWMMNVNAKQNITLKQRAVLTQMLLDQNMRQIPDDVEPHLIYLFAALAVNGTDVRLGDTIPSVRSDRNYARIHMLMTNPAFAGSMRVYLQNLAQGSSHDVACKNAFRKSGAEIEADLDVYLKAGVWKSRQLVAAPIDRKRDFSEYRIDPPLRDLIDMDSKLSQPAQWSAARDGYRAMTKPTPQDPLAWEGVALASLAMDNKADFDRAARKAIELESKNARLYFELGKLTKEERESWTMLRRATEFAPQWPLAFLELSRRENDPARKINWLKTAAQLAIRQPDYWKALAEEYDAQNKKNEALDAWSQARLSARNEKERARLESTRSEAMQSRAIAQQEEVKRKREAERRELERVREVQNARIRAFEAQINEDLEKKAGGKPIDRAAAISWAEANGYDLREKFKLLDVECTSRTRRLRVQSTKTEEKLVLFVADNSQLTVIGREEKQMLTCGIQDPVLVVYIGYKKAASAKTKSDGVAAVLEFQ
jgi:hypothetical protein